MLVPEMRRRRRRESEVTKGGSPPLVPVEGCSHWCVPEVMRLDRRSPPQSRERRWYHFRSGGGGGEGDWSEAEVLQGEV